MLRAPSLLLLACACADPGEPLDDDVVLPPDDPGCNGALALCDRPLDRVVFPAAHNAMSNADEGWALPNQQHPPARQLADGIRGLLLDTYEWQGDAWLCHGYCELGATPLVDVLGQIDAFLDEHPREVVFLVVQDDLSFERTEAAFRASGLFDRVVVPPAPGEPWPTLGELVAGGGRVVVTRESGGPGPDWYPPFYDLAFDTPYGFRDPEAFTCDLLRGDPEHALFLINHWVSNPFPDREAAAIVNEAEFLRARLADCEARWGRLPTLLAVDHYDVGDLIAVVREANAAE